MTTTATVSPAVADKVHTLIEQHRVLPVVGYEDRGMVVIGDSGPYTVRAYASEVRCECIAGVSGALCAHKAAAMVVWAEMLADPFSGIMA